MTVIIKRPYSDLKVIEVKSKTLYDLEKELDINVKPIKIGNGLILLVQRDIEFDVPNMILQDVTVYGTAYFIKAGQNRISELNIDDFDYIREMIQTENKDF